MPTTSVTVDNKFLTTTLFALVKEEVDHLHVQSPWFDMAKSKFGDGKPIWDGGERMIDPIVVAEHSDMTPMTNGYDTINLNVRDVDVPIQWTWFSGIMPIVISEFEEKQNSGKAALVKILDRRRNTVIPGFKRKFVQHTLKGGMAGYANLNTLNGVDYATGFLEAAAPGSQTNTVGGFSKSTYASLPGSNNQYYDCANSFNSNGLAGLAYIDTKIAPRHPKAGKPDALLFSEPFNQYLKRSLSAYERYTGGGGEKVDPGKMYTLWNGVPAYVETYLPNAGATTTATPVSAIACSLDFMHTVWHPQGFFEVTEFVSGRPNQHIRVATVEVMCQNKITHFGCQGLIVRGDQF